MIKYLALPFLCFFASWSIAQDTLYINRGVYTINPETIHKIVINETETFTQENAIVDVNLNESLTLYLVNNDTVPHTLNSSILSSPVSVNPSQGFLITTGALSFGTYLIYHEDSSGDLLGSGIIVRAGINGQKYSWDLWDMSPELAEDIFNGNEVTIPSVYRPTFFSINGGVDPMDMMAGAMIMGNVGDSIYISVVNTGNMIHTLHFHGYHIEILQSEKKPMSVGWKKDSFPVFVKDAMTLLLVPHQPGEFPVHNHNLVATLFNNAYPLGMATMLMIEE